MQKASLFHLKTPSWYGNLVLEIKEKNGSCNDIIMYFHTSLFEVSIVQRKQLFLNVFVTQSIAKFEKHFYVVEIVL